MRRIVINVLVSLLTAPAFAQSGRTGQGPSQPPSAGAVLVRIAQNAWAGAKRNIVESADQMPEADYSFEPVDTVRTFGQILAHVADSNYFYCARSKGEAPPVPDGTLEKTATTKASIVNPQLTLPWPGSPRRASPTTRPSTDIPRRRLSARRTGSHRQALIGVRRIRKTAG